MGITITDPDETINVFDDVNKPLLKKEIRIKVLNNIKDRVDNGDDTFYVFYAKPYSYNYPNLEASPFTVPAPTNALNEDLDIRKSITGLRKVRVTDIRKAFERYNWTTGTVYSQYSNFVDLSEEDFYVYVQDQKKVYVCLDNNNGAQSTIVPNSDDTNSFETSDGYRWQLVIAYEDSLIRKFNSENYLPEPEPDSTQIKKATKGGVIDRLDLADASPSFNYNAIEEIPFFIKGDGKEIASAEATIIPLNQVTFNGTLSTADLQISKSGTGYFLDSNRSNKVPVEFRLKTENLNAAQIAQSSDFELAYGLATIDVDNNSVIAVEVKNIGNGYPSGATVVIVQSSAIVYGTVNSDSPTPGIDFEIVEKGESYKTAKVISIFETSESIVPADDDIKVIVSPPEGHGGNIQNQLNSTSLFINTRINNDDDIFSTANDFRQLGIIENPTNTNGEKLSVDLLDTKLKIRIEADNATDFASLTEDLSLEGQLSLQKGILIDVLDVEGQPLQKDIRYVRDPLVSDTLSFIVGENLFVPDVNKVFTIRSVTDPNIDFSSGNILFINNTTEIDRNINQSETLNFIFNF